MSEYDDNNFPQEEIDRIQQEIDRDLNSFAPVETPSDGLPEAAEPAPEISHEISQPVYSGADTVPPPSTAAPADHRETFYKETIRNESDKNSKSHFKRAIAVVAVISIFGGLFAGLGYSIGPKIYNNYIAKNQDSPPGAIFTFGKENASDEQTDQPEATQVPARETRPDIQGLPNFVNVVKSIEPSVVNITTKTVNSNNFFDMQIEQPSAATGIIFSKDDNLVYIATNAHVVSGANSVQVSVQGIDPIPASPIGVDVQADLAVISVKKSDLENAGVNEVQTAYFGDSDSMEVGEWVLAIGNALGEGNTATAGIVSAKDKKINIQDRVLTVIQTNAAINPGNSGGPLVNMKGEVIGINTAKLAESASFSGSGYKVEGMGYSITSNKAKPIIEELMNRTNMPFLGIEGQDITDEIAKMYGLPSLGVFVRNVIGGTAAEAAGIVRTDIITSFDGKTVLTMEQLSEMIKQCKVGDQVEIKLLRNGDTPLTVNATLSQYSQPDF